MNKKAEMKEVYRLFLQNKPTSFIKKKIDIMRKIYEDDEKLVLELLTPYDCSDEYHKINVVNVTGINIYESPWFAEYRDKISLKRLKEILDDKFEGYRFKNFAKSYYLVYTECLEKKIESIYPNPYLGLDDETEF